VPASFYQFDIFIFVIWFFVLNGIYVGLHYYQAMKQQENLRVEDKKFREEGFRVKDGKQDFVIGFSQVIGFFVDGEYTTIVTTETKKYLLNRSLDKIEKTLPYEMFFRLNRQFIVHRNVVKGFTRIENGKLNVALSPSEYFPGHVQVSRTKAAAFKNWFDAAKA